MFDKTLPTDSVRGRILEFLSQNWGEVESPVVEIGSKLYRSEQWWANLKAACGDRGIAHTGVDIAEGQNVDIVADCAERDFVFHGFPDGLEAETFNSAICCETLEHVWSPETLLYNINCLLKPKGLLLLTTLFCFPVHGFPDDYWRFTPSALQLLLDDNGFTDIEVETKGECTIVLSDHGAGSVRRTMPIHVMAKARKL